MSRGSGRRQQERSEGSVSRTSTKSHITAPAVTVPETGRKHRGFSAAGISHRPCFGMKTSGVTQHISK